MRTVLIIFFAFGVLFGVDVYATFTIVPKKDASLMLAASGVVGEIKSDIGDVVKKGETLLILQNTEESEMLNVAKSQYEAAKLGYEFAKSQYERYVKSKDAFDPNTIEKIKYEYESNAKMVNTARFNVALSGERVSKTILKAPFDGIIAEKNVEIGDGVALGGKPLFRLISKESKLVLSFDTLYASSVKIGSEYRYKLDNKEGSCKIYKIYPSANIQNRKISAECDGGDQMSGLFGDGVIKVE